MSGPNEDCDHQWGSDGYLRVCNKCGQLRTFPGKGVEEEPVVLWPGKGAEADPKLLSKHSKSDIAHLAKEMGVKKMVKVSGLPMTAVRGWVGSYCRGEKVVAAPLPTVQIFAGAAGECAICTGEILASPFYITVGEDRRLWLHAHCAQNLAKFLELIGVACEIKS